MANITLTPSKYYQVESSRVTAIDPLVKSWYCEDTVIHDYVIAEFDIPVAIRRYLATQSSGEVADVANVNVNAYIRAYQIAYGGTPSVGDAVSYSNASLLCRGSTTNDPCVLYPYSDGNPVQNVVGKLWVALYGISTNTIQRASRGTFSAMSLTIEYTAQTVVYTPTLSPSSGYLNPAKANTFTVGAEINPAIIMNYVAESGTIYWRKTGGSYTSQAFTGNTVTLASSTLTTGEDYEFYVTATADDGTTATSSVYELTTVDAVPTVTALAPINTVTYGEVTFRWLYDVETGADQYAVDIQTSQDGVTYTMLVNHAVQSETAYTATLSDSGTIYWQVKGYNQDNVASDWSDAVMFVNNTPPDAPVITAVSASGRPTVSWTTPDQVAYQVQIVSSEGIIEDSGAIYSATKSYKAQNYLPNGSYTFKVRIYNEYGKVSDWAEMPYTQSILLPAPAFTLTTGDEGVTVTITTDPTYAVYYILRNGVPIGSTTTGEYVDRFARGTSAYTVIGVTSSDESAQSTQTVTYTARSNMLISADGTVYLINRRMNSPVGVSKQVNAMYDQANFIGASLPEHHFSKLREGRFTVVFKDYVDAENLLGSIMFYTDMYENGDWCAVVSVGRVENKYGNETTAELQLTAYDEAIAYA